MEEEWTQKTHGGVKSHKIQAAFFKDLKSSKEFHKP